MIIFALYPSFTSNMLLVLLLTVTTTAPATVNALDPRKLVQFPHYLWVDQMVHYNPQLVFIFTVVTYYTNNPQLRAYFKRQCSDVFRVLIKVFRLEKYFPATDVNCVNGTM